MSILDSLLVGLIGISVVFVVLVGLIIVLRLQSSLVSRFTNKKPAEVPTQEAPADIPSAEPAEVVETIPSADAEVETMKPSRQGAGVLFRGNGKYTVTVDNVVYEVEMEEDGVQPVVKTIQAVPASVPKPAPAPAPKPAPKPAPAPKAPAVTPAGGKEVISAPVPGTVLDIKTAVGSAVKRGDILMLLEAMKMENEIIATKDGTITQIMTSKGAAVEAGAPLVEIQ